MGPKRGSKKQPPAAGREVAGSHGDNDSEDGGDWSQQSEQEKRQVRRSLRDLYEKLSKNKEKYAAGGDNEEIGDIIKEANEVLGKVRGTQEAMEDAKMFKLLCQTVREMSEDTNTNEKKFHYDEFAMLLGNRMNARSDAGQVHVTGRQLVAFGDSVSRKFRRVPCLSFVSEAINTEAPDRPKEKVQKRQKVVERDKVATKTSIVEKNMVTEQKTDRLVNSTRKLLESLYRQQGKRPVNYFEFVIDPESFGNTVENMFHVSFLVKQRVVTLSVDDAEGLPFLEPVSGSRGGGGEDEGGKEQAVISISFHDWQDLKEALDIKKAAIVHEEDLRNK